MRTTSLALTVLAFLEAATLATGTAAAVTSDRPVTPARVVGTTASAPSVVPVRRAVPHRPAAPKARRHVAPKPHRHQARRPSRPAARRTQVRRAHPAATTPQLRMQLAIARIPGYRPGVVRWVLTSRYGHWGTAELGGSNIYISPSVPSNRMYDVVAHEWSHILSMRDYGNDVNTALAELNRVYGGSGIAGAEKAADCMARLLGARWTHYTPCASSAWRTAARRLLSGQRL
jgi:hypothetical protein